MTFADYCKKYHIELNSQQEEACRTESGETLLLAVPGSGKTTVIIARIGYLVLCCGISAGNILTITYSKAAALEMEERFFKKFGNDAGKPHFSTIHSLCVSILRYAREMHGVKTPVLEPDSNRIIRAVLYEKAREWPSDFLVKRLSTLLASVKNSLLVEEEIVRRRCQELADEYKGMKFAQFYEMYEGYKQAHNLMDFDDQLIFAYNALCDIDDVRMRFQLQYPYIEVDESQDTSQIQFEIIRLLANGGKSLFVVGDDDQSIYGFRGADPQNIIDFTATYPFAKVLYMTTNYRSSKEIVKAAGRFIKTNKRRYEKTAVANRREDGDIVLTHRETELGTYQEAFRQIDEARKQKKTLAVIARNNFMFLPLVQRLDQAGIAVRRRDNFDSFFNTPVISRIIAILALAVNPYDVDALKIARKGLKLFITNTQMNDIAVYMTSKNEATRLNAFDAIERVCATTPYVVSAMRNIRQLVEKRIPMQSPERAITTLMNEIPSGISETGHYDSDDSLSLDSIYIGTLRFFAEPYKDIMPFLEAVRKYRDSNGDKRTVRSNVTLTTIHSAKGLEFDDVIILDAIDGILPQDNWDNATDFDMEEDARLFYVAVTRAKNKVEFLCPRTLYGHRVKPSKYIGVLMNEPEPTLPTPKSIPSAATPAPKSSTRSVPAKKTFATVSSFAVGGIVDHVTFRKGVIINIAGDILTVDFEDVGEKRILKSFCKQK